jgi:hypothetical protein
LGYASLESFDVAIANMCESSKKCKELLHGTAPSPWPKNWIQQSVEKLKGWIPPEKELVDFSGQQNAFRIVQSREFLDKNGQARNAYPQLMEDHIVLLGGAFAAARDEYRTTWGKMYGVELFANGIQSKKGGYIMPGEWPPILILSILVDLALGVLAIWGLSLMTRKSGGPNETQLGASWKETIAALLLVAVSCVLLYEFYASNIWLGAVPVVAGAFLERVLNMYLELRKTRKALDRVRASSTDGKSTVTVQEGPTSTVAEIRKAA